MQFQLRKEKSLKGDFLIVDLAKVGYGLSAVANTAFATILASTAAVAKVMVVHDQR